MCEWYVAPTCCVLVRWIGRKKARCVPLTSLRARSPAFGARGRVSRQSACAYSEMWLSRLAPLGIIIRPQLAVGARLQTPTRTCTDPATLRSSSRPGLEGVGGECTSGCDVCAEMAPPKRGSGSRGRGCPPLAGKGVEGAGVWPSVLAGKLSSQGGCCSLQVSHLDRAFAMILGGAARLSGYLLRGTVRSGNMIKRGSGHRSTSRT